MIRRLGPVMALLAALTLIGLATLGSQPEPVPVPPRSERAAAPPQLADTLRNLLLFVPAGAAAALVGLRPAAVLAGGLLLSLGIEGYQLGLPGRDPSLRDVAANGAGALLGALLLGHASAWLRPAPRVGRDQ